jgi:hypothetical protein
MKKKKLVLKTETVRVMQQRELAAVQGGAYYLSATGCNNCQLNANIGGIASQPAGGCPGEVNMTPYIDPALGHG